MVFGMATDSVNPKLTIVARFRDLNFKNRLFMAQHPKLKISTGRTASLELPKLLQTSILNTISALDSGLSLNTDHQKSLQSLSLWIRMQDEQFIGWEILTDLHAVLSETGTPIIPFLNPFFDSILTIEHQFPDSYHPSRLSSSITRWKAEQRAKEAELRATSAEETIAKLMAQLALRDATK